MKIGFEWLSTGCCWGPDFVTIGRGWRIRKLPIFFGILRHPTQGVALLDLGMAPRVKEVTRQWPYWFYRLAVPFSVTPKQTALGYLKQRGIEASEVKTILLSHLHVDHIAGLQDFPQAQVVCSAKDWEFVRGVQGFEALRKATFPALLPDDLESRLTLVDPNAGQALPESLSPYSRGLDFFGDGSCWLLPMEGHSPGHMGAYLETESGPVMVAVDTCWQSVSYRENRDMPALVHKFLTADPVAFRESLEKLHQFSVRNPDVPILLSHCPEDWQP